MTNFLSCDWGTSSFRLRLVNIENMSALAEITSKHGIAAAYNEWIKTGEPENKRILFYRQYLLEQIKEMERKYNLSLTGITVVLSGMASSSIGMIEIPYKELPYIIGNNELNRQAVDPSGIFDHKMIIISGVRTGTDVLRGEETMLEGCKAMNIPGEQVYIFPGTHSKHITVKNGQAWDFKTYMTGEFFDLLSNKSILSGSLQKNEAASDQVKKSGFEKGVREAGASNLLNAVFHVRTNHLLGKISPSENYHYLSGLLIGTELRDLHLSAPAAVILVCNEELKDHYLQALEYVGPACEIQYINADEALVRGQFKIALDL